MISFIQPARVIVAVAAVVLVVSLVDSRAGQPTQFPNANSPLGALQQQINELQGHVQNISACSQVVDTIVGTWGVANVGTGLSGQVTFRADGTYTIDSGTYNAGGSWFGATSGTYRIAEGIAVAFTYSNWSNATFTREPNRDCAVSGSTQDNSFILRWVTLMT